jgi:hypothetical protein
MKARDYLEVVDPMDKMVQWKGDWWRIEDLPEDKPDDLLDLLFVYDMVDTNGYHNIDKLLSL